MILALFVVTPCYLCLLAKWDIEPIINILPTKPKRKLYKLSLVLFVDNPFLYLPSQSRKRSQSEENNKECVQYELNCTYCLIPKLKILKYRYQHWRIISKLGDSINSLNRHHNPQCGDMSLYMTDKKLDNSLGDDGRQSLHADDSSIGEKDESTKNEPNPVLITIDTRYYDW
jgi:hypothetical protein